jgi:hypothetical protein
MATQRVTGRIEGDAREATYPARDGTQVWKIIVGMAVLALVAIIAFFLLNHSRNNYLRLRAVTGASATVAGSPAAVAKNVGDAAGVATNQSAR